MQSTGPDLTETTTAPREPTDVEPTIGNPVVTECIVAEPTPAPAQPPAQASLLPEEPVATASPEPATASAAAEPAAVPPAEPDAAASEAAPAELAMPVSEPVASEPEAAASPAVASDPGDDSEDQPSLIPIVEGAPPEPPRTIFADLGLSDEVLRAIDDMGYKYPTPIQEQAIPYVLMNRDVMGTAQTGTGKTASFTLPMLDILSGSRARARMPRSLILEPTRELALQVAENFVQYGKYLKLTHALIIGGESMSDQKEILNRG
jgi:ATP-dependent helicase YprA (DUF1998 family)